MSIQPTQQENASTNSQQVFPTVPMNTVVGQVQVAEKSFDVQGKVIDSSNETPLDVNAMHYITEPDCDIQPLETGTDIILENDAKGPDEPVQENPEQTLLEKTDE